jgi:fumarate hydratase class II
MSIVSIIKEKGKEFHPVLKIGRTHLQDATPIRLGHEFGGYARQIELDIHRIRNGMDSLSELALGRHRCRNRDEHPSSLCQESHFPHSGEDRLAFP